MRFDRNGVAPTAVLKGPVFPNLMKTCVSEMPKAQNVTGPWREATKTYALGAPQKTMSIWHYNFQGFGDKGPADALFFSRAGLNWNCKVEMSLFP